MPPGPACAGLPLSALGYPMTRLAIRGFGRRGALVAEAAGAALLVRDVLMVASGAPSRLRSGPAQLLWLETATAATAVVAGIRPVMSDAARERATQSRPTALEVLRRGAVGVLFGLHTVRFWIYLQPDHGQRVTDAEQSS